MVASGSAACWIAASMMAVGKWKRMISTFDEIRDIFGNEKSRIGLILRFHGTYIEWNRYLFICAVTVPEKGLIDSFIHSSAVEVMSFEG